MTFTFAIGIALKSAAILALAWGVAWLMRHRSAASRHVVWIAAAIALLALPFLSASLPDLKIPGNQAALRGCHGDISDDRDSRWRHRIRRRVTRPRGQWRECAPRNHNAYRLAYRLAEIDSRAVGAGRGDRPRALPARLRGDVAGTPPCAILFADRDLAVELAHI